MYKSPVFNDTVYHTVSLNSFFTQYGIDPLTAIGGWASCVNHNPSCKFAGGELLGYAQTAINDAIRDVESMIDQTISGSNYVAEVPYPKTAAGNMRQSKTGLYKTVKLPRDAHEVGSYSYQSIKTSEGESKFKVSYEDRDDDGLYEIGSITIPIDDDIEIDIDNTFAKFSGMDGHNNCNDWFVDGVECKRIIVQDGQRYLYMEFKTTDLINPAAYQIGSLVPLKKKIDICCQFDDEGFIDDDDCVLINELEVVERIIVKACDDVKLHFYGRINVCDCQSPSCEDCAEHIRHGCIQKTNMQNRVRIVPADCCDESCQCGRCVRDPDTVTIRYITKPANELAISAVYALAATRMQLPHCINCGCVLGTIPTMQKQSERTGKVHGISIFNAIIKELKND